MKINNYSKENEAKYVGVGSLPLKHTHHYEIFPYAYNSIVTDNFGNIVDKQSYYNDSTNYKVIYNGDTTIVILSDGSKGIAKWNPSDQYDKFLGFNIAFTKAKIKKLQKELAKLAQQAVI